MASPPLAMRRPSPRHHHPSSNQSSLSHAEDLAPAASSSRLTVAEEDTSPRPSNIDRSRTINDIDTQGPKKNETLRAALPAGRRKSIPTYNRQRKRCSQSAAAPRADPSPAIRARSNARRGCRKARLTAHARTGTHAAPSARKTSRARTFRLASEGPRHPQHSPPATGSDASKWAPPDTAASRGMSAPQHRIQPQSRGRRGAAGTHWRPPKRPPRAAGPMLAFAPHGLCAPGDAAMPQVPRACPGWVFREPGVPWNAHRIAGPSA